MDARQKSRNEGLQNFNIGVDLKKLARQYKHINWSVYVRKAIEERISQEQRIENEKCS